MEGRVVIVTLAGGVTAVAQKVCSDFPYSVGTRRLLTLRVEPAVFTSLLEAAPVMPSALAFTPCLDLSHSPLLGWSNHGFMTRRSLI